MLKKGQLISARYDNTEVGQVLATKKFPYQYFKVERKDDQYITLTSVKFDQRVPLSIISYHYRKEHFDAREEYCHCIINDDKTTLRCRKAIAVKHEKLKTK